MLQGVMNSEVDDGRGEQRYNVKLPQFGSVANVTFLISRVRLEIHD